MVLALVLLAACHRAVPSQRAVRDDAALAPALAPAPALAIDAAAPPPDHVDAATDRPGCEPHPIPASTVTCPAPGAEVVARAHALVASVTAPDANVEPQLRFSCELARGWFVAAQFMPAPSFRDGDAVGCPPAAGDCGVSATWLLPPRGAAVRHRGIALGENLDIDGDGTAESQTSTAAGELTIWFDAGRKPVTTRQRGTWLPWHSGLVLMQLDGDPTRGFVVKTARAFRVSPAGVEDASDVVAALWRDSVAARCPVANVIEAVDPAIPHKPPSETDAQRTCAGPAADVKARLAAQITTAIADRARTRAVLITDGAPVFDWSCNRRDLAAIVTYCEGEAANACIDEHGTWWHDVWVARDRPGRDPVMTLLDRTSTGSMLMEWADTGSLTIAGDADLDGDGELDPILNYEECEGGAGRCGHRYKALVRGALLAITQLTAGKAQDTFAKAVRIPDSQADAVVLAATTPSNGNPDPRTGNPARAWSLVGGHMRQITGPAARLLIQRAK